MEKTFKVGDKVKISMGKIDKNYCVNAIHESSQSFKHYQGTYDDIITILEIGKHRSYNAILVYGIYGDDIQCCFNIEALELYESTEHYEIY